MLPEFSVAWAVPADTQESKNAPAQRGHWFRMFPTSVYLSLSDLLVSHVITTCHCSRGDWLHFRMVPVPLLRFGKVACPLFCSSLLLVQGNVSQEFSHFEKGG